VGYVLRLGKPRTDCNNDLFSRYFCHPQAAA
jgi:hypothetical protein